jgi:hypothetical protein
LCSTTGRDAELMWDMYKIDVGCWHYYLDHKIIHIILCDTKWMCFSLKNKYINPKTKLINQTSKYNLYNSLNGWRHLNSWPLGYQSSTIILKNQFNSKILIFKCIFKIWIILFFKNNFSECDKMHSEVSRHNKNNKEKDCWTLSGVVQLIRFWICSPKITSSSVTNLRATRGLHGR